MPKTDTSVEELIKRHKILEKRSKSFQMLDSSAKQVFRSNVDTYIRDIEDKITSLTGKRNTRRLEKHAKKWRAFLAEIDQTTTAPVSQIVSSSKMDLEATNLFQREPVTRKLTLYIKEWAEQLTHRISHMTSESKLESKFSQSVKSSDPEVAKKIEAMRLS